MALDRRKGFRMGYLETCHQWTVVAREKTAIPWGLGLGWWRSVYWSRAQWYVSEPLNKSTACVVPAGALPHRSGDQRGPSGKK